VVCARGQVAIKTGQRLCVRISVFRVFYLPTLMFTSFMHMMFTACNISALNPSSQDLNPEAHAAYNQCLKNQVEGGDDAMLLTCARCLGFLIIKAPGDEARNYISLKSWSVRVMAIG
jgi:hypothetical protein